MALSYDLLSQFAKITNDETNTKKESSTYGTIVKYNNAQYVKLDGSDLLTPYTSTVAVEDGDRVLVTIKNHSATVTGSTSNPSASNNTVVEIGNKVSNFEIIVADKVTAQDIEAVNAYFESIKAISGKYEELAAITAEIETLQAKYAEMEYITATDADIINAEIESLKVKFGEFTEITAEDLNAVNAEFTNITAYNANFTYVSADVLKAIKAEIKELDVTFATIESLQATNAEIENLKVNKLDAETAKITYATIDELKATNADIEDLDAKKLDAESAEIKYANIDFSNIGEAAVTKIFSDSGIIKDLIVSEGKITGELVGVTIKGDLIEGNTIVADKLVVKGEDGLFYKLNVDALGEATASSDEKYQNGIDGSVLVAESVTAEKITVDDLVAFDATIGGFKITENSIYSGVKESVDNTTRGIYLDNDGQFAFGDSSNFLKYYKDQNGEYKLIISLGSTDITSAMEEVGNLAIGGRNLLLNSEVAYPFTNTDYPDISTCKDKLVTTTATGVGNNYCWIAEDTETDNTEETEETNPYYLSIPLSDFITKVGESLIFSLDTKLTGSFTNLRYKFVIKNEDAEFLNLIISIPNDCEKGIWHRLYTIKTIEEIENVEKLNSALLYIEWGESEIGSTVEYRLPQLEFGTKPTEWSLAPEDVSSSLSDMEDDIDNRMNDVNTSINEAKSSIEILKNMISTLITDSDGNSLMTQTGDGWVFSMSDINGNLDVIQKAIENMENNQENTDDSLKKLSELINEVSNKTAYIVMAEDEYGNPCIELGKASDKYKYKLNVERIVTPTGGSGTPTYIFSVPGTIIEADIVESELLECDWNIGVIVPGFSYDDITEVYKGYDSEGNTYYYYEYITKDFKVRITNTAINFLENGKVVAYVNNEKFYTNNMIVKNELQIGEGPGFVWKVRSNGNMGLMYISS